MTKEERQNIIEEKYKTFSNMSVEAEECWKEIFPKLVEISFEKIWMMYSDDIENEHFFIDFIFPENYTVQGTFYIDEDGVYFSVKCDKDVLISNRLSRSEFLDTTIEAFAKYDNHVKCYVDNELSLTV